MALAATDYQAQILYELGLPLVGGPLPDTLTQQMMTALQQQMPTIWAISGVWAQRVYTPFVATTQFLIAKKRACACLMGQMRMRKDQMVGRVLRVSWSQVFRALYQIYQLTEAELKKELDDAGNSGLTTVTGPILQTSPLMPANQYPHVPGPLEPQTPAPAVADPNNPYYTGGFALDPLLLPWYYPQ